MSYVRRYQEKGHPFCGQTENVVGDKQTPHTWFSSEERKCIQESDINWCMLIAPSQTVGTDSQITRLSSTMDARSIFKPEPMENVLLSLGSFLKD